MAAAFHHSAFGTTVPRELRSRWIARLETSRAPEVAVIGVPFDGGTYGFRGASAGPLGIRWALHAEDLRLFGRGVVDLGDVPYWPGPFLDEMCSVALLSRARSMRFGCPDRHDPVGMLSVHEAVVRVASTTGVRVLSLGGDHSIAATALCGLARKGVALVHVDAHGDLSEGRDGLPLLHSSWVHYADMCKKLPVIVQVGIDSGEEIAKWAADRVRRVGRDEILKDPGKTAVWVAQEIRQCGATYAYLSVDIDVIDKQEAPATGLPADFGLPSEVVGAFIGELGRQVPLTGADLVEVAPPLVGLSDWGSERTCVTAARLASVLAEALMGS